MSYPPHVDEEIAKKAYQKFSRSNYDYIRDYVRSLQESDQDMSDT